MHDRHRKAMAALLGRSQPRHDLYTVFSDCMEVMAIAMANSVDRPQFDRREARYLQIVRQYRPDVVDLLPPMMPRSRRSVFRARPRSFSTASSSRASSKARSRPGCSKSKARTMQANSSAGQARRLSRIMAAISKGSEAIYGDAAPPVTWTGMPMALPFMGRPAGSSADSDHDRGRQALSGRPGSTEVSS